MPRTRRKPPPPPPPILTLGPVTVDRDHATAQVNGAALRLRPKEAHLLWTLMLNANQVMSRADLMKAVWHTDFTDDTRTLEVHMHWLRRKIEATPSHPSLLQTVRGQGYVFRWEDPPPDITAEAPPAPAE